MPWICIGLGDSTIDQERHRTVLRAYANANRLEWKECDDPCAEA